MVSKLSLNTAKSYGFFICIINQKLKLYKLNKHSKGILLQ